MCAHIFFFISILQLAANKNITQHADPESLPNVVFGKVVKLQLLPHNEKNVAAH